MLCMISGAPKGQKKLRKNLTNKLYSKANPPENAGFGDFGYLNSEGGCRDGMCRALQWGIHLVCGAVEFYLQLPARRESTGSWAFLGYLLASPDPAFGKAEARGSPICFRMLCAAPSPMGSPGGCSAPAEEEKDGIPLAVPVQGWLFCFLNKEFNPQEDF